MCDRAVERFNDLIKVKGSVNESDVAQVFDSLPAVSPEALIGKWKGGSFDTGHSTHKQLTIFKWAGKDFHSVNEVDPIMLWDEQGNRNWFPDFGHAQVSNGSDTFCTERGSLMIFSFERLNFGMLYLPL